jgi:hypothetical protein
MYVVAAGGLVARPLERTYRRTHIYIIIIITELRDNIAISFLSSTAHRLLEGFNTTGPDKLSNKQNFSMTFYQKLIVQKSFKHLSKLLDRRYQ